MLFNSLEFLLFAALFFPVYPAAPSLADDPLFVARVEVLSTEVGALAGAAEVHFEVHPFPAEGTWLAIWGCRIRWRQVVHRGEVS